MAEPKLRFKADNGREFPLWKEVKIGDLIEIYDEKVNSDCTLPILTSSKKYGIQYQNEHFGREQLHDISGYNVLPYRYCTYRNRSDGTDFTFNINMLCPKGIVSKFYPVFSSKTADIYLLTALLNNEKNVVRKIAYTAKGTGQKVLSISDLKKISIRIPSLPEQRKIATFLSTIDDIITATESELTAWKGRKKGLMQKIFNCEVRFKADDGSEFPEWEEKRLGDVTRRLTRRNKNIFSDVPLTISATYGLIDQREYFNKTVAAQDLSNYYLLQKGEFAYNRSASTGYDFGTIKRLDTYEYGAVSTLYICFSIEEHSKVCSDYLSIYFDSNIWNKYAASVCAEGARNHGLLNISIQDFFDMPVLIPSLPEQRKIAECLCSLDKAISQIQAELCKWKQFKKGLFQQMFV